MGGKLTTPQVNKAKEAFSQLYDEDGDGRINKDELKKAISGVGGYVSDADLEEMISGADADGNGTIEIKEFLGHVQKRLDAFKNVEELKAAFRQHDTNNDGYISRADFDLWIKGLIVKSSSSPESKFRVALDELIFDDEGRLNFEEYCAMMATYSLGDGEMTGIAEMEDKDDKRDNLVKEMSFNVI